jgi:hypothetical protein
MKRFVPLSLAFFAAHALFVGAVLTLATLQ